MDPNPNNTYDYDYDIISICGSSDSDRLFLPQILSEIVKLDGEIIEILKYLRDKVNVHHKNCNIAKTGGTLTGATGIGLTLAGLFLTIPTGGLSLALTIGGLATTVVGVVTNSGTEITRQILMKKIQTKIKVLLDERERVHEEYRIRMDEMNNLLSELDDIGIGISKNEISDEEKQFSSRMNNIEVEDKMIQNKKSYSGAGEIVFRGSNRFGYVATGTLSTILQVQSSTTAHTTAMVVIQGAGHIGSQIALKSITTIFSIGFVLVDTAFLVRDWNKVPDLAKEIKELLVKLEQEKSECGVKLEELKNYNNNNSGFSIEHLL